MTYRERMEAKLERRRIWADARDKKAAGLLKRNEPFRGDHAFNTQPGHIPERARVIAREDKAFEHMGMAGHHRAAADGLERALNRSIFSDDPNAKEAIEARIKENEAKRERMKLINKLYRKGDAAKLAELGLNYEAMKTRLEDPKTLSWCRIPYAAYELSNLGGRITADRKRLTAVKIRSDRKAAAEASPNGVTIEGSGNYVSITFAEKPDREILTALKDANFYWGGGSWSGRREAIPESVNALLATTEATGATA